MSQPTKSHEEMCPIPKPRDKPPQDIAFETKLYTFKVKGVRGSRGTTSTTNPPGTTARTLAIPELPEGADKKTFNQYLNVLKVFTMDLEHKNTGYLIFHHRNDDWWQLGGRSLLFYKHHMEEHYQLPSLSVKEDRDYGSNQWKHGCANIKNVYTLIAQITEKAHCVQVLESPNLKIFKTRDTYTENEIRNFEGIVKHKEERLMKIICPKLVLPKLFKLVETLNVITTNQVANIPASKRRLIGYSGVKLTQPLVLRYNAMCNDRLDRKTFFKESIATIDSYFDWLLMIKSFHVIKLETLGKMADISYKIKQGFEDELIKLQKKNDK